MPVINAYGLTETGTILITDPDDENSQNCVGGPLKHIQIKIKDIPHLNYFTKDPKPRG